MELLTLMGRRRTPCGSKAGARPIPTHYSGIYRRDIPAPARSGYTCRLGALRAGDVVAFYDHAVTAVRGIYDRRIHTPPILDSGHYFPAAARFAGAWQDIRREALAVAGMLPDIPRFHELMPEQADISANDGRDWRMFMMKVYGVPMKDEPGALPDRGGAAR